MKTKKVRINKSGNAKTGIKALEDTGLITCEHGKFIVMKNPEAPNEPKKNDVKQAMNTYSISTKFLYNDTDTTTENPGDETEKYEAIAE